MHDFGASIDQPRKDTGRHASAGSRVVVAVAPTELALIRKMDTSRFTLEALSELLGAQKLDVLLLEGFHTEVSRRSDVVKIITAKDERDALDRLEGTSAPVLAITGVISAREHPSQIAGIRVVDLDDNGQTLTDEIAALVKPTDS